jgi:outer membrane lipoprotein-sorting protein
MTKPRAVSATISPLIRSLILMETTTTRSPEGERRFVNKLWYQIPDRWRTETATAGQVSLVTVSDGTSVWDYHPHERLVTVNQRSPQQDVLRRYFPLGRPVGSLAELLQGLRACYAPKLRGTETVGSRVARVIDLGVTRCKSSAALEYDGRRVIWVDRETLLLLRSVQYTVAGDIYEVREVSRMQVNGPIDPARFTFTPPPGVRVSDFRPKPPPTRAEFQAELQRLAKAVDFPLLVPHNLPEGYVPLWPRPEPYGVELGYAPAAEAWQNTPDTPGGISVLQRRATPSDVAAVPERAEPVQLNGAQGWFTPAVRHVDGTGAAAWLSMTQDGTWVAISSFALDRTAMLRLASSLQPVAGGRPALPRPVPRTLREVRQRVRFPVFVPTRVSPGITPEPPVGGEKPGDVVSITYHRPDGSIALRVVSGPDGCCLAADPRKRTGPVALPGGRTGYLLDEPARFGGPILWWEQERSYIALSSPVFGKEDLLRIAAALSSTADLDKTELPHHRPLPRPLPPPQFRVLRPTWLPEPVTVREEYIEGATGHGSGIVIGFDPRPGDRPHEVLRLREVPEADEPATDGARERIAGRDVTVVRRGEDCVHFAWTEGDVRLTLSNPYDPPGHLRYSCQQLRRVVESIR